MSLELMKAALAIPCTGLLDLPIEILHPILKSVFKDSQHTPSSGFGECVSKRRERQDLRFRDTSAVLRTCKKLYREGLALYYQNIFYCRSTESPKMQMRRLMTNDMRMHIRKFVGFPYSSSLGHWTEMVKHFPQLETLIFFAGYDVGMPLRQDIPFGLDRHPQRDLSDKNDAAAEIKGRFYIQNQAYGMQAVLEARPRLSISVIVHFIFRHTRRNPFHAISLVDLREGNIIRGLHSHDLCRYADQYRTQTAQLELRRPCNPWDCEWIASRNNLIDLIVEDKAIIERCENRIARRADRLLFEVFTFHDKAKADPLYQEKVFHALNFDPRVANMGVFMELYREGEWDHWCPHGGKWEKSCGCPRISQGKWVTYRGEGKALGDDDYDYDELDQE